MAGHGEGESRFVASEKVTAKLQSSLHFFDLIVGTEEEFHIAGGSTGHRGRAASGAGGLAGDARLQARGARGGRLPGRRPGTPRRRRVRPRLPDRGLQRPRRRRRLHVGPVEGLARRRGLADRAEVRQRLRRLRRVPPRLHAGLPELGGAAVLLRARDRPQGPAQRRRARAGPLGHQPARGLVGNAGLRLRPPRATRATGRRVARADRRLQAPLPRGGAARFREVGMVTASSATAGSARTRSTLPRAEVSGSAGRWNGPAPVR